MIDFNWILSYTIFIMKTLAKRSMIMLFQHRKEKILNLLSESNTVRIHDLVTRIGASESTIRRDLMTLEEEGLLTRVHGGATNVKNIGIEQKKKKKESINHEIKAKIAKYCSTLVKPSSQIYIDAGTATIKNRF